MSTTILALFSSLSLFLAATPALQAGSAGASPELVLLISIDGLMPDCYRNPDRYGLKIPNLREFAEKGSSFAGVTGVFPTVTYPSHTAAVTGVLPAANGIISNTPLDPFDSTRGGWYWYASDLRVPALWDAARAAGKKTGSVFWPVTVGAAIDFNYPEYRIIQADDDVKLLRTLATPGLVEGIEARYGRFPGQRLDDLNRTQSAAYIIEQHRPNLMLLHLIDLDGAQHYSGPGSSEALATLEKIDGYLGMLKDAVARAGLSEGTTWVIMSDHGFREVSQDFNPRVVLHSLGYLTFDAQDKLKEWRIEARTAGGIFALESRDPGDEEARRETIRAFRQLAENPRFSIERLYSPEELREMGAFPEAFLAGEAAAGFKMGQNHRGPLVTPTSTKGMHGYHPDRPDQRAALILSGRGIARGRHAEAGRLIDVAPTIAHLLGLSLPQATGSVLLSTLEEKP